MREWNIEKINHIVIKLLINPKAFFFFALIFLFLFVIAFDIYYRYRNQATQSHVKRRREQRQWFLLGIEREDSIHARVQLPKPVSTAEPP